MVKHGNEYIRSSLPLLKNFKFYFQFEYLPQPANQVENIVASFATPFYIQEKKWFTRCDMSSEDDYFAALYSIPFTFDQFTICTDSFNKSISTLLNNNNINSNGNIYANLKTLIIEKGDIKPNENLNKSEIINLIIHTDFCFQNWLHILIKLSHLSLEGTAIMSSKAFNTLLNNTPNLYSLAMKKSLLRIVTDDCMNVSVCNGLSNKIRYLKLHSSTDQSECLNENDYHYILQPFVSKCSHLSFSIESETYIIGFILRYMNYLNSLHVHIMKKINASSITMKWLNQHYTKHNDSNCIIVIENKTVIFGYKKSHNTLINIYTELF